MFKAKDMFNKAKESRADTLTFTETKKKGK